MSEHESGGRRAGDPEERPAMHPTRCADHPGMQADLAAAEATMAADREDRAVIRSSLSAIETRLRNLEVRFAIVVGVGMVLSPYLPRLIDALTPVAHAIVAIAGR